MGTVNIDLEDAFVPALQVASSELDLVLTIALPDIGKSVLQGRAYIFELGGDASLFFPLENSKIRLLRGLLWILVVAESTRHVF